MNTNDRNELYHARYDTGVDLDQLISTHGHRPIALTLDMQISGLKAIASGWRGITGDKLALLAERFLEFSVSKTVQALAFKRRKNGKFKGGNS
jgi:hypothetical protein